MIGGQTGLAQLTTDAVDRTHPPYHHTYHSIGVGTLKVGIHMAAWDGNTNAVERLVKANPYRLTSGNAYTISLATTGTAAAGAPRS